MYLFNVTLTAIDRVTNAQTTRFLIHLTITACQIINRRAKSPQHALRGCRGIRNLLENP